MTRKYQTPPEVAKLLGVSASKVRSWIARGELKASDISLARGGRPRHTIAEADLEEFLLSRAAVTRPASAGRRPSPPVVLRPPGWIDFFAADRATSALPPPPSAGDGSTPSPDRRPIRRLAPARCP